MMLCCDIILLSDHILYHHALITVIRTEFLDANNNKLANPCWRSTQCLLMLLMFYILVSRDPDSTGWRNMANQATVEPPLMGL